MLTYNIKLNFENKTQEEYWRNLLQSCILCYNDISELVWNNPKVNLGLKPIHALCYEDMRIKYPELPSQMLIRLYKSVIAAYRSNKRKFKCTKKQKSCQLDKRLYSKLTPTSIKLCNGALHYRSDVKFELYKKFNDLASKYIMKDPNMFIRNDEIYLGIPFDVTTKPVIEEKYLGVDLGVRRLVTTSDGEVIDNKPLKAIKRKIRKLRRDLQRRKTYAARKHLKKLQRKEHNLNKNYCHWIANQILKTDKTVIVLEDLKKIKIKTSRTKEGYKRTKHNNRLAQVPFYMLRQILTYKAPLFGKRVETVSPWNTSKINCMTGKLDGGRIGCRYYTTNGEVYDADWNASINIMLRKHPGSFRKPVDGGLNFLGRVFVNDPNLTEEILLKDAESLVQH